MPFAVVEGRAGHRVAARSLHPAVRARGVPRGVRGTARPTAVSDPPPEPRHPRHPDRRDLAAVRQVHRAHEGDAVRARRRVPRHGRDAGRDQVADAAAALRRWRGRRRGSARRARATPSGVRAFQEGGPGHRRSRADGARRAAGERGRRRAPVVTKLPEITLKELLLVFKEALDRSTMFAHHHVRREPLSVRERMSNILVDAASRALRRLRALVRSDGRQRSA